MTEEERAFLEKEPFWKVKSIASTNGTTGDPNYGVPFITGRSRCQLC